MSLAIRHRLLFSLLPVTLFIWVLVVVVIYAASRNEVDDLIDAQLVQSARGLLNVLSHEFYEEDQFRQKVMSHTLDIPQSLGVFAHKYEQKLAFQMWLLPKRLALRSENAPQEPMSSLANGFSYRQLDGRRWRVYTLTNKDRSMQIQVGEGSDIRERLRNLIAMRILIPMLIAFPVLGLLIWYGVGRAMRPLNNIAADVENRQLDQLSPIDARDVPDEAQSLVSALNTLFRRVQQAFENERRFTSDAAHELRTPLAALKTHAQVALRATTSERRRESLQQMITGVDRATHMVQQLLTLARIDPRVGVVTEQQVDLNEVVSTVLAELAPEALAKNIDLSLHMPDCNTLMGDHAMLAILVRNLVDNAIKYTPDGGVVEVRVNNTAKGVVLSVADSGPGIPEGERVQVFERFYRRLGTAASGTGLGLSIVKRIAELHWGEISLEPSGQQGLQVNVCFNALAFPQRRGRAVDSS